MDDIQMRALIQWILDEEHGQAERLAGDPPRDPDDDESDRERREANLISLD